MESFALYNFNFLHFITPPSLCHLWNWYQGMETNEVLSGAEKKIYYVVYLSSLDPQEKKSYICKYNLLVFTFQYDINYRKLR